MGRLLSGSIDLTKLIEEAKKLNKAFNKAENGISMVMLTFG